jgi:hypothetical protein
MPTPELAPSARRLIVVFRIVLELATLPKLRGAKRRDLRCSLARPAGQHGLSRSYRSTAEREWRGDVLRTVTMAAHGSIKVSVFKWIARNVYGDSAATGGARWPGPAHSQSNSVDGLGLRRSDVRSNPRGLLSHQEWRQLWECF